MMRSVPPDGRLAADAFVPIERPRLVERIASAARQRVALIVAPAGFGKSVALRQFLERCDEPRVRYDLHADNANLLGFVRGFADALLEIAPDARKTVSGAYERSRTSPTPGEDLALWLHAHLRSHTGLVALDDLHYVEQDPEVMRLLASLIDRTKDRIRWILASRSSPDLPVGSWLAYGEMDLAIDERDLRFTTGEARAAARAAHVSVRDEELSALLDLTDGWPTALSFALRSSTRSVDLRSIASSTREMIFSYLAEQVYRSLSDPERDFLTLAALLPEIDVRVLKHAGYDRAISIVEDLRHRVAFIYAERPGVYRCHDLFRDFLHHQLSLSGERAAKAARLRVAAALEAADHTAAALSIYGDASDDSAVLRIIEQRGFDLIEQGHGDAVAHAIGSLDERLRREEPAVLAMRGLLEAGAGRFDEAESLLERAIRRAPEPHLAGRVAVRLAPLLMNQGRDVSGLLRRFAVIETSELETALEALALLAAQLSLSEDHAGAREAIWQVRDRLDLIDSDSTRAKLLQRLGFASFNCGDIEMARDYLTRAADLASRNGLHSLASRALASLSTLALQADDDAALQLWYADQAAAAATKGGDTFDLQTALLLAINAEMQRGNSERMMALQSRLSKIRTSDRSRAFLILPCNAALLAWEGKFSDAHRLLLNAWERQRNPFDRIIAGAECAFYLAMDGLERDASALVRRVLDLVDKGSWQSLRAENSAQFTLLLCSLTEAICGRPATAEKVLRSIRCKRPVVQAVHNAVAGLVLALKKRGVGLDEVAQKIQAVRILGYGGLARLFEIAAKRISEREATSLVALTQAEVRILRALAIGDSPKEIAASSGRSVNTVRAHIQNAIVKLGCSGSVEAVIQARRLGMLG